jgi:mTERF domain-containing protein
MNATLEKRLAVIEELGCNTASATRRLAHSGHGLPPPERIHAVHSYITRELRLSNRVFERFPAIFSYSIEENLRPTAQYVTGTLALPASVLERMPSLFGRARARIEATVAYITEELGLSQGVLARFPTVFGCSLEENIRPKVAFLTQTLGLSIDSFERHPALFGYSISRRLLPRARMAREQGKNVNYKLFAVSDKQFFERFGCTREAYAAEQRDATPYCIRG